MSKQSKNWVFTVYHPFIATPTVNELKLYLDGVVMKWPCVFLTAQIERCPLTKKLHIQGYIIAERRYTLSAIKKAFDQKAHFEIRKGSHDEAAAYCCKDDSAEKDEDGNYVRRKYGVEPTQGKRVDLDNMLQKLKNGADIKSVAAANPSQYIQYYKGLNHFKHLFSAKRNWPMDVTIIFGPTGCGKSRYGYDNFPNAFIKDGTKWWNGYNGEFTVIIDEFAGQMDFLSMLTLLDRYPHQIEYKGDYMNFSSKRIIFTSNLDPAAWYPDKDMSPFFRRITRIFKYDNDSKATDGKWYMHKCPADYIKYNSGLTNNWERMLQLPKLPALLGEFDANEVTDGLESDDEELPEDVVAPATPPKQVREKVIPETPIKKRKLNSDLDNMSYLAYIAAGIKEGSVKVLNCNFEYRTLEDMNSKGISVDTYNGLPKALQANYIKTDRMGNPWKDIVEISDEEEEKAPVSRLSKQEIAKRAEAAMKKAIEKAKQYEGIDDDDDNNIKMNMSEMSKFVDKLLVEDKERAELDAFLEESCDNSDGFAHGGGDTKVEEDCNKQQESLNESGCEKENY